MCGGNSRKLSPPPTTTIDASRLGRSETAGGFDESLLSVQHARRAARGALVLVRVSWFFPAKESLDGHLAARAHARQDFRVLQIGIVDELGGERGADGHGEPQAERRRKLDAKQAEHKARRQRSFRVPL